MSSIRRIRHFQRLSTSSRTFSLLLLGLRSATGFWLPSWSPLLFPSRFSQKMTTKLNDATKEQPRKSSSSSLSSASSKSLLSDIHDAIELVTQPQDTIQQQLNHKFGLTLRQIVNWEDNYDALVVVDSVPSDKKMLVNEYKELALPLHFCLSLKNGAPVEEEDDNSSTSSSSQLNGLVTFYMAYSTWEGRMLYLDHLSIMKSSTSEENIAEIELLALQALARIAIHLNCKRLMWRVRSRKLPM